MFKYLILIAILSFSFVNNDDDSYDPARYYVVVDSEEEAKQIADKFNGELISYVDGVATFSLNRPIQEFIRNTAGIDIYATQESSNVNGEKITLQRDNVYYPTEDIKNGNPLNNVKLDPKPLEKMDWVNTYRNGITGNGAIVAVIDTGCNINHEDLKENIVGVYNSSLGNTDVTDKNGHGTHVSGIILARDNDKGIVGVAPDAKLYVIKASYNDKVFYTSDLIKGLNKCIEIGNINVINMSLGGGGYDANFKQAIERCMNNGILVVCAAGNEATDSPCYPAAYGFGLSVASYDPSYEDKLSVFSNYGDNANVVAPGSRIYSCCTTSNYSYIYKSGTSMACPHVAGVAALIYGNQNISKNRSGAESVKNIILNSTDDITYYVSGHSIKGGVNVQNIFKQPKVSRPDKPTITTIKNDDGTVKVTIKSNYEIIYTTDGSAPTVYNGMKYKKAIKIKDPGSCNIRAVAINKRYMSKEVSKSVYIEVTPEMVEATELQAPKYVSAGQSFQVTNTKNISPSEFKWSSSDTSVATIDKNGSVTVLKTATAGIKFKIKAKSCGIKKKIKITVK